MEYYKINIKSFYEERIASGVDGKNVPEKEYFHKIGNGEIMEGTPIFDYFILKSFDEKKYWEWALFDVHNFIGVGSVMSGWYISDIFKTFLENFKIAEKFHFYETRLLYKGKKLKYWIFQFIASYRKLNKMQYIDFAKSIFYTNNQDYFLSSYREWSDINEEIYDKYDEELKIKKVVLTEFFDFIPLNPISSDVIVSETLKQVIEKNNITGFEFSELDYEVVVE